MKPCIRPSITRQDKRFTVYISFTHKSVSKYIPTIYLVSKNQIKPTTGEIINHPNATAINKRLRELMSKYEERMTSLGGRLGNYTAGALREYLMASDFKEQPFIDFGNTEIKRLREEGRTGTANIYEFALKKADDYSPGINISEITADWLEGFEKYLRKTSNDHSISIHIRAVRAIYGFALKKKIISYDAYPFRDYKIPEGEEPDKKNLSIQDLAKLFFSNGLTPREDMARKIGMLTFYFAGINFIDLMQLPASDKDYIEYLREKSKRTKKKKIKLRIKIQPEAQAIIDEYKGDDRLLALPYKYANTSDLRGYITRLLKIAAKKAGVEKWQKVCLYSFRDSWATLAYNNTNLRIEDIGIGLGHSAKGMSRVTFSYVNYDFSIIDRANRHLIDMILEYRQNIVNSQK